MSKDQADVQEFEKAAAVLLEEVYLPAFIKRCSELGITFKDDEDLAAALENVVTIKAAEAQIPETQSLHKQANVALKGLMNTTEEADFERFLRELA